MDFLSLPFYVALAPFFSILQSPEASISLITESLHLNGRLCIVRTKGRAASEEVLDRGMDWAQLLGWVEVQVQASLRQHKGGLHSNGIGIWEDVRAAAEMQLIIVKFQCKALYGAILANKDECDVH